MAGFYQPVHAMIFPDIVVFLVPKLKPTLDQLFTLIESGRDVPQSSWSLNYWNGNRYALALEVDHHGIEFKLFLPPQMWSDIIPAILQARVIGIIADRQYYHEEEGMVEAFYLDEHNILRRVMYKVYGVDTGLRKMIPQLNDLKARWNPNGLVTYLLHTLGQPLDISG